MSGERGQEKWPEAGEPCAGRLRWPRDETDVPMGQPKTQALMLMTLMLVLQKLMPMLWLRCWLAAAQSPASGVSEHENKEGGQAAEAAVPGARGGVHQREQREGTVQGGGEHPEERLRVHWC